MLAVILIGVATVFSALTHIDPSKDLPTKFLWISTLQPYFQLGSQIATLLALAPIAKLLRERSHQDQSKVDLQAAESRLETAKESLALSKQSLMQEKENAKNLLDEKHELAGKLALTAEALERTQKQVKDLEFKSKSQLDNHGQVLQFLYHLQDKGRLLDFVMQDISSYNDAQVSAAARVVHGGLSKVIREFFEIEPLSAQPEGAKVEIDAQYDPIEHRILGNETKSQAHEGTIAHRGWRAKSINLPSVRETRSSKNVIAPVQIQLS